jgi:hypothetical protein|tara:strand:- start:32392 stop:32709 length:318 start_codon:yes stop_codon:yes gene_type:complete
MERIFSASEAISSLVPTAQFSVVHNDDGTVNKINWVGGGTQPTEVEINAEISRLQAEYDALDYSRKRKTEYDVLNQFELIGEDSINGTSKHKDAILAIKKKFPKP